MNAVMVDLDGRLSVAKPMDLRALVVGHGSLVHLVERSGIATMCGAYAIEELTSAGYIDDQVCPACIEHLRTHWQKEQELSSQTT